ncbi:MAG: FMN-binding protein [bacterium]|nr:FMN-binding protein [bacterium]
MKKSLWTIVFMIMMTVVFISVLAFINETTKDMIAQNLQLEKYKSILYAFDIFPQGLSERDYDLSATTAEIQWQETQMLETINCNMKTVKLAVPEAMRSLLKQSFLAVSDSVEIYVRLEGDSAMAYGFQMKGKGLWGTITGFGVISSDLEKMIGIDFTDQVETPGLGARILENEFKQYFRNLDLSGFHEQTSDKKPIIMVNQKKSSNLEHSTNSLQAITGATQTCDGVLKMVNIDLKFYIELIKNNQQQLAI